MGAIVNQRHASPADYDHQVIAFRRAAAELRHDHARAARTTSLLILFVPLSVLLLSAELLAGLYLFLVLTFVVVCAALAL